MSSAKCLNVLTHWGRVTHICVGNLTIVGSDNGLSPGRRQAIIWTNAGILLIWPLWTNFSEILTEIHAFSFQKIHFKISSGKRRPFCLGLNVLTNEYTPFVTCWIHPHEPYALHYTLLFLLTCALIILIWCSLLNRCNALQICGAWRPVTHRSAGWTEIKVTPYESYHTGTQCRYTMRTVTMDIVLIWYFRKRTKTEQYNQYGFGMEWLKASRFCSQNCRTDRWILTLSELISNWGHFPDTVRCRYNH